MTRTTILWSLFAVQALCCGYFLFDLVLDFVQPANVNPLADSDVVEGIVTITLFFGLAFTGTELARTLRRQSQIEEQLQVASGAFEAVLNKRFDDWSLTEAERHVAILAIKGFSIAEIADIRKTAQGTTKAQAAAVYRKADVSGRLQLLSLFLDDLMSDALVAAAPSA
jgi:DNA-binding CsgD family transcriptional regulator